METEWQYPNHLGLVESLISPMTDEQYNLELGMANGNPDLEGLQSIMRAGDEKYLNMTFQDE